MANDVLLPWLRSPLNGRALTRVGRHLLGDGAELWPYVDGIAYLRTGRETLRHLAVTAIQRGDLTEATALLMTDRKDSSIPPVGLAATRQAVEKHRTAQASMELLNYGPLGTYFLHRMSEPTYLSALVLLEKHAPRDALLFEIGCGTGHFLRAWSNHSGPALGADVVFSHLWLARHFLAPIAQLVCFDAEGPFPLADGIAGAALTHDSFHYYQDKSHLVTELRRVTGNGPLMFGHVHNADGDNRSPGRPLTVPDYFRLLAPDLSYDDAALVAAALTDTVPTPEHPQALAKADAAAFVCHARPSDRPDGIVMPRKGARLILNPLIGASGMNWPSAAFAEEFADERSYLVGLQHPGADIIRTAEMVGYGFDDEVDQLTRRRVFVEHVEEWW